MRMIECVCVCVTDGLLPSLRSILVTSVYEVELHDAEYQGQVTIRCRQLTKPSQRQSNDDEA